MRVRSQTPSDGHWVTLGCGYSDADEDATTYGRRRRVAHGHYNVWRGDEFPDPEEGTLYRGREGMWSWVAHRITGVLIFFFLFAHVLDASLLRVSPARLQQRHQQL